MKHFLILATMLSLFGIRLAVKATGHNDKPSGPVVEYEYTYSGTMRFPLRWYLVKRDSTGRATLLYSDGEPEITVYRAPDDVFERIAAITGEYKLHRLRESYRPRMLVLDGYGWSVHIRCEKGSIHSGGGNAWPPARLNAGINTINNYLQSIVDNAAEADVIGRDDHDSFYKRRNR